MSLVGSFLAGWLVVGRLFRDPLYTGVVLLFMFYSPYIAV